jgi:hypothetical protein
MDKDFPVYNGISILGPKLFKLSLYQRESFEDIYYGIGFESGEPVDLSAYDIRLSVARRTLAKPLLSLTVGNGLTVSGNELTIAFTSLQTELIAGRSVADVKFTAGGRVFYGLEFAIDTAPSVTR